MRNLIAAMAAAACLTASAATIQPVIPADAEIEQKIEQTLARMTLDEKIGQMTELEINMLGQPGPDGKFQLNPEMLDLVIGKFKVGSILNAPGTRAQSIEDWHRLIGQIQEKSMAEIGIPCIYGLDQNHGTTYTLGGTMLPQNINMGATFNPALVRQGAEMTAYETRAAGCPWTYSPTLDLTRDQRWPRLWENYGEDCLVNAVMGAAAVRGFQGDDPNHVDRIHIGACLKHYMGYGAPHSGKDRAPAYISEADLREKHFAPYLNAIRNGALSVMVNSASVNGVPTHANRRLLTQWLKEETGWDGMVVTDWADINNLFGREKIAADKKEAICMAINSGIDMSMDPYDLNYCTLLKEAVEEGLVPMSRIDDAVRRVLRLKYRLGLFDQPMPVGGYDDFGSPAHRQIARDAVTESMVLLKNTDDILPLAQGRKILVTGPNADSMRALNGGWTYSWQGKLQPGDFADCNTILQAMRQRFGADNIIYAPGVTYNEDGLYWEENAPDIDAAVAAAAGADCIVACIGENSYCETPGNLTDLRLSDNQTALVKALAATGKPLVLVLNEGRPRLINDIEPLAAAVVDIMLPGSFGGDALASLLAGDANFSGRLPFTYPRENASLTTYDFKVSEQMDKMEGAYDYDAVVSVQWPFGYGRSYTTFGYDNLRVDKPEFADGDTLTFTVDVTNTGSRPGKEAVMLFTGDDVASRIVPDNRRLRAFEKIELAPGQTRTVSLTIPASDLAYVDADGRWLLEAGTFRAQIGNQVLPLRCTATTQYPGANK